MTALIEPVGSGRASLRRGDRGHDVIALQLALRNAGYLVTVDGVYGVSTESAVFDYQREKGLVADGIAGPAVNQTFVFAQCLRYGKQLPKLMLPSIGMNESGCKLGARSPVRPDGGYDLGWAQRAIGGKEGALPIQQNLHDALSVPFMAKLTAATILGRYELYRRWGKVSVRRCWELAVLGWNWPYAANRLAAGLSIFTDPARDDVPQQWVIAASGGRLRTAREWAASYVAKATALVEW